MKKVALMSFLLLFAAGCNTYRNTTTNQAPTTTDSQTQTYKNSTYGFEFNYPEDAFFKTSNYGLLQDKVVELGISQNDYANTNFGDAAFSVSASYAKSLENCLAMNAPESGDDFKIEKQINGISFHMTKSTGAGAGNIYDSTIYRTLVGNQTCIELNETIHTSNIGNYPAGTITEVNKAEVQSNLDRILNTFKFSK
jgi:hypothetical protein